MSDYTPGTWRYFKNVDETFSVIPADALTDESYAETVIAEVFTDGIADPEANARLMSAAPELLEAVKIMCKGYKATREFFAGMGLSTSALTEIIADADGLIDRVEGRSEK